MSLFNVSLVGVSMVKLEAEVDAQNEIDARSKFIALLSSELSEDIGVTLLETPLYEIDYGPEDIVVSKRP